MQGDFQSMFRYIPGAEQVTKGLADVAAQSATEEALVVLVASPRLRRLGIEIPESPISRPYEHALYTLIEQRHGHGALSYYNSVLRRMVSFCRALEQEALLQSDPNES